MFAMLKTIDMKKKIANIAIIVVLSIGLWMAGESALVGYGKRQWYAGYRQAQSDLWDSSRMWKMEIKRLHEHKWALLSIIHSLETEKNTMLKKTVTKRTVVGKHDASDKLRSWRCELCETRFQDSSPLLTHLMIDHEKWTLGVDYKSGVITEGTIDDQLVKVQ